MEPSLAAFQRAMIEMHAAPAARGEAWLAQLPALIEACERRWSFSVGPAFSDLSYNYVAPAICSDGTAVVLKLGVPSDEHRTEIAALKFYDGRGSVRLVESDAEQGVLVLERLRPGVLLSTLADDEAATSIAATVMQKLWRPVPAGHTFSTIADWFDAFAELRQKHAGRPGPLPAALADRAERVFAELMSTMGQPVLLHGDLHHYNILTAEREPWLAIDPKGIMGEAEYEVGALLRNPFEVYKWPEQVRIQDRRLDQLSEQLGFDRQRLLAWSFAQAVLSAVWTVLDHGHGWEPTVALAESLQGQMRRA